MRPFEEWIQYQGHEHSSLTDEELEAYQQFYAEACEAEHLRMEWSPKVAGAGALTYAAAVRDDDRRLWLFAWVRRSPKGEYFVMRPFGEKGWDPHSSYHRDGRLHHKSHGRKVAGPYRRQPLDATFQGAEQIIGLSPLQLDAVRAVKVTCNPEHFTGILEVPGAVVRAPNIVLSVDITEPGKEPQALPWSSVVGQKRFTDCVPEVVLTVWKQNPPPWPAPTTDRPRFLDDE